jgi:hypothetical protein
MYEYDTLMGLGTNGKDGAADPRAQFQAQVDRIEQEAAARNGMQPNMPPASGLAVGAGIGALALLLLGVVVIGIATPFALGAVGAAITGPKGMKKAAAKKGAIYGGLAGIGAGIVLTVVSGALESVRQGSGRYIGGSGLVPFAVGLYIGYKEKEKLSK